MENKLKLIIRIIASPFVFALLIISHFTFVIIRTTDLVVCEFFGGGAANSAYYFLGSSSGLGNKTLIGQATTEYCTSLVVGDFNNDGFGDVVIGDASDGSGTGRIRNGTVR